jgi:acetylglutamate kinase
MESQAYNESDQYEETHNNEDPTRSRVMGEPNVRGAIVVKIGGSTLGSHDTTLKDLVTLQQQGINCVVVHGGGKIISDWMEKQGVRPRFIRGLRVTDPQSLDIAVAVLTGLINKQLVASLVSLGAKAMGISGADNGMLRAHIKDEELGLVGAITSVNADPIKAILKAGCIPVIAPVGVLYSDDSKTDGSLLNINADTAAGEIAAAINSERLVFLTDVEGVLDASRRLIPRLTQRQAVSLIHSNIAAGGMVPKLEACLTALKQGGEARIVDGRKPGALIDSLSKASMGTRIG